MAVGYRSFLRVAPGQRLLDTVVEHLGHWLETKEIHLDAGCAGQYVLDHDDLVTIVRHRAGDGQLYLWRRRHPDAQPRDVWRTTITALEQPGEPGWLWTEIETRDDRAEPGQAPFNRCMSVPSVLRGLLGTLSMRDGRTDAAPAPQWVSAGHLPDLMDFLADESRRGPVYMLNQGDQPREEFDRWTREVTWHLVGLGSAFLMEPAVAAEFNEMVGAGHAVPPGTMRTYLPEVDLDDADDPTRHRILGRPRIETTDVRRLARMLGRAERDRAAGRPVPAEVSELVRACEPPSWTADAASASAEAIAWRDQQRELALLRAENRRLREALPPRLAIAPERTAS